MSHPHEVPVGRLGEYNGIYSLGFYADDGELDQHRSLLEQHGHYPNGHGWSNLFENFLHKKDQALAETLKYDPEADMISIRSQWRESILQVSQLLAQLLHDPTLLQQLVDQTEPD
jgi:Immunity protein 51